MGLVQGLTLEQAVCTVVTRAFNNCKLPCKFLLHAHVGQGYRQGSCYKLLDSATPQRQNNQGICHTNPSCIVSSCMTAAVLICMLEMRQ